MVTAADATDFDFLRFFFLRLYYVLRARQVKCTNIHAVVLCLTSVLVTAEDQAVTFPLETQEAALCAVPTSGHEYTLQQWMQGIAMIIIVFVLVFIYRKMQQTRRPGQNGEAPCYAVATCSTHSLGDREQDHQALFKQR